MAVVTREKSGWRELRYDPAKFAVTENPDGSVTLNPGAGAGTVIIVWGPGDSQTHNIDSDPAGQSVTYDKNKKTATIKEEGTV